MPRALQNSVRLRGVANVGWVVAREEFSELAVDTKALVKTTTSITLRIKSAATRIFIVVMVVLGIAIPLTTANASASVTKKSPAPLPVAPSRMHPNTCVGPGAALSTPAGNSVAFVAEASLGQVEEVSQSTGAVVGSAIAVGTNPTGISFWTPAPGVSGDPEVVVTNKGSNNVTVIDATTRTILATIALPSGSAPTSVASSPTAQLAAVTDSGTGKVSIINLANNTDAADISLTTTTNALSSVVFQAGGGFVFVTDPVDQKIFVLEQTSTSSPFMTNETSDTISPSYKPTSIATDLTNSASSIVVIAGAGTSSGALYKYTNSTGVFSAPTTMATFSSSVPSQVLLNPGATFSYVTFQSSTTLDKVNTSTNALTSSTLSTTPGTSVFATTGTSLLVGSSASASIGNYLLTGSSPSLQFSGTPSGVVSAMATPLITSTSWNAYVVVGGSSPAIDVINTQTYGITQSIPDTHTPYAVAVSPDGAYAYVAEAQSIGIIATADIGTSVNPMVADVSIPSSWSLPNPASLNGIMVSPNDDSVVVTDFGNNGVYVLDTNPNDGTSYRTFVSHSAITGGSSSTQSPQGGIAFAPDGKFAYFTEAGSTGSDGISIFQQGSSSSVGFSYVTTNSGLTQGGSAMEVPTQIAISPDDEYAYVTGTNSTESPIGGLFTFPIKANGQIDNGSSSVGPTFTGTSDLRVVLRFDRSVVA